ncbi:MAG TPA: hypothetical protein VJP78_01930 [Thermoleophilia bacterium]|nr:hypothetical protein [Thermoleophilia bacterium]
MKDRLYEEFYDPTDDFAKEPRAFCYDLASQLIAEAKRTARNDWLQDTNTVKGVLLLLFAWNFAAKETKRLNFENVGTLLRKAKPDLQFLEKYSITDADKKTWRHIKKTFEVFRSVCGQTGASKALGLLNPRLFVMWDTAIRSRLNKGLVPGIGNGQTGEQYVVFLKGVQRIIQKYKIAGKLPPDSIIAKKFDEYNYVRIVMQTKRA